MSAYYNENDPKAAAWLRELIRERAIAPGDVDERSIEDVTPHELVGYRQCHFFAGIGGWSYALRLAGWPDDRAVWTGSCPCQPFSAAGKGRGFDDERHLWPVWHWLIRQCRPDVVLGEQVANALPWLDLVSCDMENEGYTFGASVIGAHSVGAPHIRQRLYWVAHHHQTGLSEQRRGGLLDGVGAAQRDDVDGRGADGELADGVSERRKRRTDTERSAGEDAAERCESLPNTERCGVDGGNASAEREQRSRQHGQQPADGGADWLEHTGGDGRIERGTESGERSAEPRRSSLVLGHTSGAGLEGRSMPAGGRADQRAAWTPSDFVWCRDGKWRPVEPGSFPLAHGVSERVGLLRGYGNAIVPQAAAAFIEATGLV